MLSANVNCAVVRQRKTDLNGDRNLAFALPVVSSTAGRAASTSMVVIPPTAVWATQSHFGLVPVLKKSGGARSFAVDGSARDISFSVPCRVFVGRAAEGGIFAEAKVADADNRARMAQASSMSPQQPPSAIDFGASTGSGVVEEVHITTSGGGSGNSSWNNGGNGGFGGWSGRGDDSNSDDEFGPGRLGGDQRSLKMLATSIFGGLFGMVKARVDADPQFLFKLAVAEAVMFTSRVAAEVKKRGPAFWDEFAFVISSVGNGVISQFFLVLALAPVCAEYAKRRCAGTGLGARFRCAVDTLPTYFFEPSVKGLKPFTLAERVAGFFYKAIVFSMIGLVSGAGGAAVSHGMVSLKKRANPEYEPSHKLPRIIDVGMQYGLFCAISSTPRYHSVNGMEAWLAQNVSKGNEQALYWGILCLRWVNNFYGGSQWISWSHWLSDAARRRRDPAFEPARRCRLYPFFPLVAHLQCK